MEELEGFTKVEIFHLLYNLLCLKERAKGLKGWNLQLVCAIV